MRFGAPVSGYSDDPEKWADNVKQNGYSAAYCPVDAEASDSLIMDFFKAAALNDITIAEVGAWSNPISPDENARNEALLKCKKNLELAEKIGARCCVNISGSRSRQWDGPHEDNLTDETFEIIVDSVREIIDAVKPERTFYTLETMPWAYPDTADIYLKLIEAVDRKQFAAHLDPVNMINNPWTYYNNRLLIRDCFKKLGRYIRSCHAKDIILSGKLTLHLDETIPGAGILCYKTYVSELKKIDPDAPLMLEHLKTEDEYKTAAAYVRRFI